MSKVDEQHKKSEEFNALTHRVFKQSADGAKWLSLVQQDFILGLPVAHPDKDPNHAYFREGQNTLIRQIASIVRQVEQEAKASTGSK